MRKVDPNVVAGLIMMALCVLLAVPVVLELVAGAATTTGPTWLWWAVYAAFLVALVLTVWFDDHLGQAVPGWLLGLLVSSAGAVVLLGPEFPWLPILLVVTAAVSNHHAPARVSAAIIIANVVVAGTAPLLVGGPVAAAVITGVLYLMLQSATVLLITALRREEAARRQLAEAHAELAATGAVLAQTSAAQERLRISRELHDLVGHQLTALTLELEIATHRARDGGAEHVDRARGIARDLLADVRSTVGELRRRTPDLVSTLDRIAAELPRPAVHVRVADDVETDEERTVTVVRCVQEILTNAIRHADASHVWIDVDAEPGGGVRLCARDDGRGAAADIVPGNGLRGLAERAAALGGTVDYGASSRAGFTVTAVLP